MGESPADSWREKPVPQGVSDEGLLMIVDYAAGKLAEINDMNVEAHGASHNSETLQKASSEFETIIGVLDLVVPISADESWGSRIQALTERQS